MHNKINTKVLVTYDANFEFLLITSQSSHLIYGLQLIHCSSCIWCFNTCVTTCDELHYSIMNEDVLPLLQYTEGISCAHRDFSCTQTHTLHTFYRLCRLHNTHTRACKHTYTCAHIESIKNAKCSSFKNIAIVTQQNNIGESVYYSGT